MAKFAETSDPLQKNLRNIKKQWNKAYKVFRLKMSAMSKTLNGRGDLSVGLHPTDIKEPLPDEFHSFITELVNNFHTLTEAAFHIEEAQKAYSETVQKRIEHKNEPKLALASLSAKVIISNHEMDTLLAITPEEQEKGLMYREWPPPVMSFISSPKINKFWMKATPSPLDILFSFNGKIRSIHKGEPFSTKLIGDDLESDLVVELPFGTCASLGIKIGDEIILKNI